MAVNAAMNVKIGADTSELEKELISAQNNLRKFEAALKRSTDVNEIQYLSRNVGILKNQIASMQTTVGKTKTNFMEWGRVLQDLPFGFQGIQNNLTQLVPAAGAAGLAFSALIAAVTFAQTGFGAWTRGLGQTKEELDKLKEPAEKATATVSELTINIDLAKRGFLDKQKVLHQYNDTIGKTTGQVKTLDEAELALVKNGDAYIRMMLLKASANLALEKAAKSSVEAEESRRKSDKDFVTTLNSIFTAVAQSGDATIDHEKVNLEKGKKNKLEAIKAAQDAANKQIDIAKKFQQDAANIAKDFNFDFFGGTEDEKTQKVKKIKEEIDWRVKLHNIIASHWRAEQQMTAPIGTPTGPASAGMAGPGATLSNREFGLEQGLGFESIILKQQEMAANQKAYNEALVQTSAIASTLTPVFDGVFTAISQGQNVFEAFGNAIKALIGKLIAAAAAAFALSMVTGGIGGKMVGSELVGGFKNFFGQLSGLPKFASGGITNGPTLAMVGDNPSGREMIIPSEKWDSMFNAMGGGNQVIVPEVRVSGQDLLLVFDRATNSRNRRY